MMERLGFFLMGIGVGLLVAHVSIWYLYWKKRG